MIGISPHDVTAVIITRGDLPELMEERRAQFERLEFGAVLICESPDVYSRYLFAERFVETRAVFFQDDDVALGDEDIRQILANYEPGILVCSMYDEWIEGMHYEDLAMVGLGSVCDVGLWKPEFERWFKAYPDVAHDERMAWDADFIFGVLCRWKRFDFNAQAAILPEASNENRLWRQPGQHERKYETVEMARKLRTVTGAVMCKNEAANIERAIRSVAPMCSSITLLDTGSTDDTVEVAVRVCDELGLELFVSKADFEGFAPTRNLLLHLARQNGDYFLMFDADEEWLGDKELPPLQMDVHIVNYSGPIMYGHPRIIFKNFPCWFEGKVHASMTWEHHARGMLLDKLVIDHHGDLTHGDIAARLGNDIRLLTEDIEEGNDVAHSLFMRAKAYEGLSEWESARKDYEARLDIEDEGLEGIPAEQRYYTMFRLGVLLTEHFGQFAEGADWLMTAWLYRPHRIESIRVLARYLNVVADAAPLPQNDILFVHRDEYKRPEGGLTWLQGSVGARTVARPSGMSLLRLPVVRSVR